MLGTRVTASRLHDCDVFLAFRDGPLHGHEMRSIDN